jgi:hypothetical protein
MEDKDMKVNKRLIGFVIALIAILGVAAAGFFLVGSPLEAFAVQDDDSGEDAAEGADQPITGDALEAASTAALEYLGEGRVTATEVGDEEGYYEVEVTLDNGRQVDVHLDEKFNVLGQEGDEEDDDD